LPRNPNLSTKTKKNSENPSENLIISEIFRNLGKILKNQ